VRVRVPPPAPLEGIEAISSATASGLTSAVQVAYRSASSAGGGVWTVGGPIKLLISTLPASTFERSTFRQSSHRRSIASRSCLRLGRSVRAASFASIHSPICHRRRTMEKKMMGQRSLDRCEKHISGDLIGSGSSRRCKNCGREWLHSEAAWRRLALVSDLDDRLWFLLLDGPSGPPRE